MTATVRELRYANVIVDVPVPQPLDYGLAGGRGDGAGIGQRCVVPLGRGARIGIVVGVTDQSTIEPSKLKPITRMLDEIAPLSSDWLQLTRFAAEYYHHSWGEVALPALPRALRSVPGPRYERSIARLRERPLSQWIESAPPPSALTGEQSAAIEALRMAEGFAPYLLFGVTGSGKTEVYLAAIAARLAANPAAQALLLVPEINLTPQLEALVRARFPDHSVVALHSGLADAERAAAWLAVHEGRARIVVGTRLAVFASMPHLDVIVVDEEHDPSYKAGEGVRYSARDLAVKRAQLLNVPVVLGSATPSLETWAQARAGRYRLLPLTERVGVSTWIATAADGRADRRACPPTARRVIGADHAGADRHARARRTIAGVSKPPRLRAGRGVRSVWLAVAVSALFGVRGVSQAGSDVALSSLRIRSTGTARVSDVRQSTSEERRARYAAHRRNTAGIAASGTHLTHRPRFNAAASRGTASARCGTRRRGRCAGRHADDCQGARFSACLSGGRAQLRRATGITRFPRPGAPVCDLDAGGRTCRPRRTAESNAGANAFR